jgi:hypothetical protein
MKSLPNVFALLPSSGRTSCLVRTNAVEACSTFDPGARVKITLEGAAPVERYFGVKSTTRN